MKHLHLFIFSLIIVSGFSPGDLLGESPPDLERLTEVQNPMADVNDPVSQVFVSSNTMSRIGIYSILTDESIFKWGFRNFADDADGLFYDSQNDAIYQLNRSKNVIDAYSNVNESFQNGNLPPRLTSRSFSRFENGREVAVYNNRMVIAQDASPENGDENELVIYSVKPRGIGYEKKYSVDINLWGITLDRNDLYAVVDNSNKIALFKKIFNNRDRSNVDPDETFEVQGLTRTHGITYYAKEDLMILTDIGSAGSATDGGLIIIHDFSSAGEDNYISRDEQIRVYGNNTHLGNPVDVAYDPAFNMIYVAERANEGGQMLGFEMPTSSGNFAPAYDDLFPGASSVNLHSFAGDIVLPEERTGQLFVSSNTQSTINVLNVSDWNNIKARKMNSQAQDADGIYFDWENDFLYQLNRTDNVINTYTEVNKMLDFNKDPDLEYTSSSDFSNGREISVADDRMIVAQDASETNSNQNALALYSISSGELSFDQKFNVDVNLWGIHLEDSDLWAIEDNSNRLLQFRNIFAQSGDSISPTDVYEVEGIVRTHGISYSPSSDIMFLTDVGDAASDSDGAFVIVYNFSDAAADGVISTDEQIRVDGDETKLGNPVDIAFDAVNQMIYIAERANQGGLILGFRTPNTSGNVAPVYSKKFSGASAVYFSGEDEEVEAPEKISQFFVSSNTEGEVGTFDVFSNNMLEMNSFDVKGDDADGVYFNRKQDALYQVNRSANRLVAYSDINKSLNEGKNPKYTGHSLKDFTNGRGLASHNDRLVVAQDASAENDFENKLYIYVASPTTFGLFKTYDVDFNVWGIELDGPHMYAVEDNSNKIVYIKNFFNYREGKVDPTEEYIIEDLVRTHGITYDSKKDVMVLTDIGSAASDSDGALVIINNFKKASADNIIRTDEQIRISGSKTLLGNPVDVAVDTEENEVYVAERAKSGGLVLAFDIPETSGNYAPYYTKNFPGASSIDRAGVPQKMEEPGNQPEIVVEDPGFGSDILVTSRLTGGAQVPSVETDGVGVATVHFNEEWTMGTINVTVSGLSSAFAGAHIHEAPAGENGDVLINMSDSYSNGRITQSFEITDSLMTKLLEGHLYVNVHTEDNPGGELRGQLSLEAPHSYTGWMSGSSEVPSVEAEASGLVTAHYTPNTNILELNAQWSGLTGPITGAHLHMGSSGENGDVVENLTDLVIGESIKVKIEAGDYIEALNNGNIYLNVHTEANPGGEIRAQLAPTQGVVIDTWLTGDQEAPSADNNGIGLGLFVLDSELSTVDYWVQTSSLTGAITGAHIHSGALGVSGDVVLNLTDGIDGWTIQGEDAAVSAELVGTMLSGDNYINVHTEAFPAGEVRGQLYRLARDGYAFNICPDQQVNAPVMADSVSGSGIFAYNRGMDEAHLMVVSNELSSDFAGSHIHNGVMGEDGDVILNFSDAFMNNGAFLYFTDSSATPMTSEFAELVRMGETYVNIHTENNPGGELRGQIIKELLECGAEADTTNQPEIVVEDPGFGSDILVTSRLTGGAQVPSVETDGVGVATVHFNEEWTMGTINVTVSGLSSAFAGAHIHEAPAGENGDVLINMSDSYSNGRITQSFEITDSLMTKLLEGHLYVNVHTEDNPGGELRGQLSLEAPHSYTGWMSGSSEVPSVEAEASGLVTAHYTPNTNILELNAQWSGLTGPITGAHLHMGAAGENGDVVENLTDLVIGESIKVKIEAGDYIEALNNGNIYLNVHTDANPGGEIRAQLAPTQGVVIDTWLTGDQEAPSADNNGIGLGLFVLDSELETVDYWVQTSSLTGSITGAHIHSGALGVSGDVVLNLTDGIDGWTIQGEDAAVSAELVGTMLSGDNYINVHTEAFPAGEVRGQLYRLARDGYAFNICPDQQVNAPVMADSVSGSGIFAYNRGMDEAHLMVVSNELSSDFAGSHIHNGVMGEDGDVILNFSDAFMNNGAFLYFTDSSATPMTSEFAELVRMGETYVNIHTENNPGGELRGQIIKELLECGAEADTTNQPEIVVEDPGFGSDILVTSRLTGGAQVPSVETDGVGVATVHFNEEWTMGTINVTVSGLSSAFAGAHIHEAPAGENGDVLINMSDSYSNGRITQSFEITDSLMTKLLEGHLYVNVHTEDNPGGELRGQLSLEAPHSYTGWMSGSSEVPSVEAEASGLVTAHYTPNTNILELNAQWSGLTGPITGAHLHMGAAGENGDVVENLTDLVIGESIKVKIEAGDYIEALNNGNIYLNVHTDANPGGEIRAQLAPTQGVVIDTWLTGDQEAPSADNNGIGLGLFVLDSELETVDYWVQTSSLTGSITGAHIHSGALGVSGDVVLNLTDGIDGWTIQGEDAAVSAELVGTMLSGDNYINVHTEAFPAGEVRGQLYRLARDGYAFNICPDQQVNAPVMADSVSGSGIFAYNRGMDEAHLMVVSNELSSDFAGSHIHNGVMGEDGDVILNFSDAFMNNGAFLYFTDSSATPMTSEFAELVRMGETYVNIHTENNPGGELRGQIIKELLECGAEADTTNQPEIVVEDPGFGSDILVTSRLTGGAQVPSVETDGVGVATVHFNEEWTMGTINVTVSGLSSAFAGAHIHEAPAGENGDVLINMSDSYSNGRITQSFEITDSLMTKLLEGHLYVNVHTEDNPGGELRGQLSLEAPHSYTGWMSGSSEVPSVEAEASGLVTAHYTPNTNILELNAQWSGLTGPITGAHLHMGSSGENGDVVENLTDLVIGESIKVKIEAGDYIEALNNGNIYLNVHTEANPGGEIRAQLAPTQGVVIDTWLTGDQEAPSADNNGIGLGLFVLDSELETVDYWVQTSSLTGSITGAHIHSGALGVSGDVVLNLTDGIDGWTIQGEDAAVSAELVGTMLSGDNYINVHTEAFPAGEVRGQLYRLARDGYAFNICPDQQVNAPVMADSVSGSGIFAYNRGMDEAHLMVVSNELSSDFAGSHIHNGVMGEDGDVILNFSDAFMNNGAFLYFTDSSATPMTSEFAELVRMGETYVNIHTENNPGGELRGQIIKELLECGDLADSTGLKAVPDEIEVSVFPNPVANYVSLEFPELRPQEINSLKVSIINYQGDVVRQINNSSDVDYIDVSSLSSGIYFVRVISSEGVHSKKFLKK